MSTAGPWNIARIAEALPDAALRMRFLSEVNLAPVDDIQDVARKWQRIAESLKAGYQRALEVRAYEEEYGHLPPELIRVSDTDLRQATGLDTKGAA